MTHNSGWFIESPFPKACNLYNPHPHRHEPQAELDQLHWNNHFLASPDPIPPIFGSRNNNPLSPWSKLISNDHESKLDHLAISGLIPQQSQQEGGINEKLRFSDDEDEDPVTPVKNDQYCKEGVEQGQLHTTGRKSELQGTGKRSRPRQKGLRKLSQRAFQIVQELRNATYKEVAAKLVLELNEQELQAENKEEQNIKRRVYDALNVLIALGVLRKDGRRIVSERGAKRGQKAESCNSQQLQALKKKMVVKALSLDEKRRKLKQAQDKLRSITTLLKRNKDTSFSKQIIIPFPFIGIFIAVKALEKLNMEKKEQFVLKSDQPLQPFGDIDSLKWLKESLERLSLEDKQENENNSSRKVERVT